MNEKEIKIIRGVFSFFKRKGWYIFLLILSTKYVLFYKYHIYQLEHFNAVNLIFILWLVLLLLPLFSEMEFFGIKLKKEIEKTKIETKETLNELRMQMNTVESKISNSNTITVNNDYLPTKEKIEEVTNEYFPNPVKDIPKTIVTDGKKDTKGHYKTETEERDQSVFLFRVRLAIEKALTDLCDKTDYSGSKSIFEMSKYLNQLQVIGGRTVESISQITKITNRGIHGEIVDDVYIDFIESVLPELQKELIEINHRFTPYTCPRCKHFGYYLYDSVCHNCSYVLTPD